LSRRRDIGKAVREAAGDPESFTRCRRRLERAIDGSCVGEAQWAAGVAGAIRAALAFADEDPVAARVIAVHSAHRRYGGEAEFAALVGRLATRLQEGAPATANSERTARNAITRVARQALLALERPSGPPPSTIAPELIVFALTPFVGLAEAQRWADETPSFGLCGT
jgi:hypothetical protein